VGGNGGEEFLWHVPIDSEPTAILVWAIPGQFVHGIQFRLSNGESSPLFGRHTGVLSQIDLKGKVIAGFGGRRGVYVDQVRFYLRDKSE
jgi:hypothetical protein